MNKNKKTATLTWTKARGVVTFYNYNDSIGVEFTAAAKPYSDGVWLVSAGHPLPERMTKFSLSITDIEYDPLSIDPAILELEAAKAYRQEWLRWQAEAEKYKQEAEEAWDKVTTLQQALEEMRELRETLNRLDLGEDEDE